MKKSIIICAFALILLLQPLLIVCANAAEPPIMESRIFVHYAQPDKDRPQPPSVERGYYTTFSKWKTTGVDFEVNPNIPGSTLDTAVVFNEVAAAAGEWDDGSFSLTDDWSGVNPNLFDEITISTKTYSAGWWSAMDGANTILWAPLSGAESNVIAVTQIWSNRVLGIVEFDMIFNTAWSWGVVTEGNNGVMDIRNIATHELGHAVGMGDLYKTVAAKETMYGYSGYGEISKQDLYIGDQAGITKLYP
jgi:hypothetical protein